jgi:hypothetical protein
VAPNRSSERACNCRKLPSSRETALLGRNAGLDCAGVLQLHAHRCELGIKKQRQACYQLMRHTGRLWRRRSQTGAKTHMHVPHKKDARTCMLWTLNRACLSIHHLTKEQRMRPPPTPTVTTVQQ